MEEVPRRWLAIALAVVPLVAGCGSSGTSATPTACLARTSDYLTALRAAPGAVRLQGGTPISSCFGETQASGEFANVGQAVIKAATVLNAKARRQPASHTTVELGYLDGAVRKGTSNDVEGAVELVRRLESAARYNPGGGSPGAAFERAYGKGYAAGENSG
jgi:hypothetical protein